MDSLPERIEAAVEREELILDALDNTYHRGQMDYVIFSAARDATMARIAALGFEAQAIAKEQPNEG